MGKEIIEQSSLCMSNMKITRRFRWESGDNVLGIQADFITRTCGTTSRSFLSEGSFQVKYNLMYPRILSFNKGKPSKYVPPTLFDSREGYFISTYASPYDDISQGKRIPDNE